MNAQTPGNKKEALKWDEIIKRETWWAALYKSVLCTETRTNICINICTSLHSRTEQGCTKPPLAPGPHLASVLSPFKGASLGFCSSAEHREKES